MRRSLILLTIASAVAIAALALASVGLSHAQATKENFGLMGSSMHRMDQNDEIDRDESMPTRKANQRLLANHVKLSR